MNDQHKEALEKDWLSKSDKLIAIKQELSSSKTQYAQPIAEAISDLEDESLRFPPLIRQLFDEMSKEPGLTK